MRLLPPSLGSTGDKVSLRIQVMLLASILVLFSNIAAADINTTAQQIKGSQISTTLHVVQYLRRSIPVHSLGQVPDHFQCALVHSAKDQCVWISENCNDQDSGLLSYLELYYCRLPQAKPIAMIIILFWLAILFSTIGITASDYFCINLSTISTVLGLSESVAGVTLLAFGNGSPDVFSTWAAMSTNSGSLAIGELIGAAGFITGIVAGSMAIVRPFKVSRMSFMRDLGFFIVATAFSLGFLVDGHLQLWECILMVGFYLFYVSVVIIWHWRSQKRKAKKTRDQLARQQSLVPEYTDNSANEADEEDTVVGAPRNHRTEDDTSGLERSEVMNFGEDYEDEETRERYMAEIKTKMRIRRPRGVSRENSRNPIRPSLIGALEFRAVLYSHERSTSQLSIPLYMRRYSEDAVSGLEQQSRLKRANSDLDPIAIPPADFMDQGLYRDEPISARPRAVSTNALDDARISTQVPASGRLLIANDFINERQYNLPRLSIPTEIDTGTTFGSYLRGSPALLTPASAERTPQSLSPISPTNIDSRVISHHDAISLGVPDSTVPSAKSQEPQNGSAEGSYFSTYHDDSRRGRRSRASSFLLPPPIMQDDADAHKHSLISWWPCRFLPAPDELFSTLFPTLCDFFEKGWLERILSLLTAPSVFLLNITLPVVESSGKDDDGQADRPVKSSGNNTNQDDPRTFNSHTPIIRTEDENGRLQPTTTISSDNQNNPLSSEKPSGWNRWLLCIQLLIAPQFVAAIGWANIDDDHDIKSLLLCLVIGAVVALIMLLGLLLTTNEKTPPSWRPFFCLLGFVVSISWISTIANEVVGILKALGIILNISEAILGLTVFAVGSRYAPIMPLLSPLTLSNPVHSTN